MSEIKPDEWGAFFNLKCWQAFMDEVTHSMDSTTKELITLSGVELYRAQGVALALHKIAGFPDEKMKRREDAD